MADTLETFGTFSGATVALVRRPRTDADVHLLTGTPSAQAVYTLTLTKGGTVTDLAAVEDTGSGSGSLATTGKVVAAALGAVAA